MESSISGILLVDKPVGPTSHDMVSKLRRILKIKKIGHAGTLDPAATGLLILLIGKPATKRSSEFLGCDKTYDVVLTLGIKTTTADHTGDVIEAKVVPEISVERIEMIFNQFLGEIDQVPPMVSAKKVKGKKLYELARKGIEIERAPVKITISEMKIKKISLPQIHFQVTSSKGAYMRTLCEDIGNKLECGGHMSALRRLACGDYKVANAILGKSLDELGKEKLEECIVRL